MGRPRKVDESKDNRWEDDVKSEEKQVITPEIEDKLPDTEEIIPTLPSKPLLRVSEVAAYFDVTDRTVYLWIAHGHLVTELTPRGQWRITRESVDKCRFKKKVKEEDDE